MKNIYKFFLLLSFFVFIFCPFASRAETDVVGDVSFDACDPNKETRTWVGVTTKEGTAWTNAIYGNNVFVATRAKSSKETEIMTSSDGVNWTNRGTNGYLMGDIVFGKELFVTVGAENGNVYKKGVLTSKDGMSWDFQKIPIPANYYNKGKEIALYYFGPIFFVNNLFVAFDNRAVWTSTDGIKWDYHYNGIRLDPLKGMAYGNGMYVAINSNGQIISSSNAIDWKIENSAPKESKNFSLVYGNGIFVASYSVDRVDSEGNGYRTGHTLISKDGIKWETKNQEYHFTSIAYGDGVFVATALMNTSIYVSKDAIHWTAEPFSWHEDGIFGEYGRIAYGNGTFVIVGMSGGYQVFFSKNAKEQCINTKCGTKKADWVLGALPLRSWWRQESITYGNGVFAVTSGKMISTDGITWRDDYTYNGPDEYYKTVHGAENNYPFKTAYGNGMFVTVGYYLTIVNSKLYYFPDIKYSKDGLNWTFIPRGKDFPGALTNVTYGNGMFVASGQAYDKNFEKDDGSFIMTSTDGVNWKTSKINYDLNSFNYFDHYADRGFSFTSTVIAYGNGIFIAQAVEAGKGFDAFNIITSTDGVNWNILKRNVRFFWNDIIYVNNKFVAVGKYEKDTSNNWQGAVMTSTDGINWDFQKSILDEPTEIVHGNGLYIVINGFEKERTKAEVMISTDAINWAIEATHKDLQINSLAYGNDVFVGLVLRVKNSPNWSSYSLVRKENYTSEASTCGSANGKNYDILPTIGLCTSGGATNINENSNGWTWKCCDTNCSAGKTSASLECGVAHKTTVEANSLTSTSAGLCSAGSAINFQVFNGKYYWRCNDGMLTSSWCYADIKIKNDGMCGKSNGKSFSIAPTTYLCSSGTATAVTSNGVSWKWQCKGKNGGSDVNCSAKVIILDKGECGSANGTTVAKGSLTGSSSNLCSAGSVINFQFYANRYYWRCADLVKVAGTVSPWCSAGLK